MTLPEITTSQQQIIKLIYRFRFLSRIHIQKILNHKNPSTINQWLTDLTEKKYIYRIYSKKFNENTKPSIYHININGIRFLKSSGNYQTEHMQKLYHENKRSAGFRIHSLGLADFICNLVDFSRKNNEHIKVLTRTDYETGDDEFKELLIKLAPDLYFSYSGTGIAKMGFVEMIDENEPSFAIRRKIRRYIQYLQQGDWDAVNDEKFPSLIFILPSIKKSKLLQRMIKQMRYEFNDEDLNTELRCNLALISNIQKDSIASPIWIKV